MDSPSSSQMSCGSTGVELCASPTSQMVSTLALTPTQIEQQQEEMLRRKYGGLPSKKALLAKHSTSIKKYFDSGEWALATEGKAPADVLGVSKAIESLPKLYL